MATLGFLGDLLGLNNGDATIAAAQKNQTAVTDYGTNANNIIDTGAQQAGGYLGQQQDLYSPLASLGQQAGTMYANSLGLNGQAGNDAATAAFQQSPGSQYNLDQQLQALDRGAAAHGQLQSGESGLDYMKAASGNASQDFNNWQSQLGSSDSILGTGLSGEANSLGNLASLATGTASAKTGVATNTLNGTLGANNQTAAGQTANTEGLSNLFGNIVGGGLSYASGGLSGLAKYASGGMGYGGF